MTETKKKQVWTDFEDVQRGIESYAEDGGVPHIRVWYDGDDSMVISIITSSSTLEMSTYAQNLDKSANLYDVREFAELILGSIERLEKTLELLEYP